MLNLVRNNIDIDEKEKIKLLDIKLLELFLPKQEKLLEECRNRKKENKEYTKLQKDLISVHMAITTMRS
jgi:hypothetical protein|tara:strand:+ start:939 stop:1145 length:207 start_codon:yes stop_codon:yes gene_type:complete